MPVEGNTLSDHVAATIEKNRKVVRDLRAVG